MHLALNNSRNVATSKNRMNNDGAQGGQRRPARTRQPQPEGPISRAKISQKNEGLAVVARHFISGALGVVYSFCNLVPWDGDG